MLLADFKTTRASAGPAQPAPAAYVAQLALYRLLLSEIYPGRRVRPSWSGPPGPSIQELRSEDLDRALGLVKAA